MEHQRSTADVVRVHQRGRICGHEGCATILSVYDPAQHCAAHAGEQGERRRGVLRAVPEAACNDCGSAPRTTVPDDAA